MLRKINLPHFLILLLFCCTPPASPTKPDAIWLPQLISLDGDWDFTYEPRPPSRGSEADKTPVPPEDGAFLAKMPVPGYWDDHIDTVRTGDRFWSLARFNPRYRPIEFPMGDSPPDASLLYLQGLGWYRKTFRAPESWKAHLVTLRVGGVRQEAWVWLNGNLVGHHLGHSTPFEMPLQASLRAGENGLVVAVANTREDRGGCALRGYQGRTGGIYRSVSLKVTGSPRIKSCYLRAMESGQRVSWNVELEGMGYGPETTLRWQIRDPENGRVLGAGATAAKQATVSWETETFQMRPWSDHDPKLYEIEISLSRGPVALDSHKQSYGLRLLTRDGIGLRLNGRPVMLRGGTDIYYFPLTTLAPGNVEFYRDRIRTLKQLGFNWIRFHTWVPSEEYMQAADELGMMLQVEPPSGFGEQEWVDILKTCRKHPSVVIYCPGNEEMLDDTKIVFLRRLAQLLRTHAPDGLFNPQEGMRGVEYRMSERDDLGPDPVEEPFPHNPRRLNLLKEVSDVFGAFVRGQLSYSSVQGDWRRLDRELVIYGRPILSHENGIHGNYLNLDLEHRFEGTRIGTDLFASVRRNLQKKGLLSRAALYYRNSCAWMKILRKHNLEMTRKSSYISGYDLLGPFDQNWHRSGYPCGILNDFFELKPGESAADVLKYNGESVLLLDHTNYRNYLAGDKVRFAVLASLYGSSALEQGTLRWHLADDGGRVHRRGEFSVRNVTNATVEKLGQVEAVLPDLAHAAKLTLFVRLHGGEYEVNNDWDFWVFPRGAPLKVNGAADDTVISRIGSRYRGLRTAGESDDASPRIVSDLDDGALAFLERGGTVFLMGPGPFPALPTSFQMSQTGRPQGNLATVIEDHPLMRRFPHDGYCDWQFYSMLQGQSARDQYVGFPARSGRQGPSAVDFSELDAAFDPIIEVVSSFKLIRKQAALFEWKVGAGRLLVCTLNLDPADPAAAYLLDSILAYIASDEFHPRTEVAVQAIAGLISRNLSRP